MFFGSLITLLIEFKETAKLIKSDFIFHNRKRENGIWINCIWHPSFRLLLNYRIGHWCYKRKFKLITALLKYRQYRYHSCFIAYSAKLGQKIKFSHPLNIIIGEEVVIGDNVKIWQGVTLGSSGKKGIPQAYPVIQNGVKIYANATILGCVKIGKQAVIGAGSLVLQDVPDFCTAVGSPAKIIAPKEEN